MYITRCTLWYGPRGDVVQVEAALLTPWWDPLVAHTLNVGPFDDPHERGYEALSRCVEWFNLYGYQPQLLDEL